MDSKSYWSNEAERFDSIYEQSSSGKVQGIQNRLFRRDMEGRFRFTLDHALTEPAPDILEIGCGTGVYTAALLKNGASFVTGIDLSERMLEIARRRLADFLGRFELIAADFMTVELKATFDISIIVGVFDYIESPQPFLHKAAAAARKSVIVTFPRAGTVRSCLRRCRLSLKGCPVYFYTKQDIEKLSDACGLLVKHYEKIGQLHCVVLVKR